MSDVSLNANAMDDLLSPVSKSRKNSGEDDDAIHIKIKQRDADGEWCVSNGYLWMNVSM